ncbi:MAG: hypothetical protein LBG43_02380 [Treponema sp.]|jgi:phosphopantetheine adenylyltransferase|nr:hypothetical protein [Treponema sp.]
MEILTYISRIDGIFTRKKVIANFLKEFDIEQDDIEIDDYVTGLADFRVSATQYKNIIKNISISENLIEKSRETAGKDPLRIGVFEILKNSLKTTTASKKSSLINKRK